MLFQYHKSLDDAVHCIELNPSWVRVCRSCPSPPILQNADPNTTSAFENNKLTTERAPFLFRALQAYIRKGEALQKLGNLDDAISTFQKGLEIEPGNKLLQIAKWKAEQFAASAQEGPSGEAAGQKRTAPDAVGPPSDAKRAKCEHGRRRNKCKDCGGSGICVHQRIRSNCKECGGSKFCSHGREKSKCKECGGSAICSHGREKRRCKECGGSGLCAAHGREKSRCRECGGSGICVHGRQKYSCKVCGGKGICAHGREKIKCKDCGGTGICAHGKQKFRCKECRVNTSTSVAAASKLLTQFRSS